MDELMVMSLMGMFLELYTMRQLLKTMGLKGGRYEKFLSTLGSELEQIYLGE